MPRRRSRHYYRHLLAVLLVAVLLRAWLILSGSVSFDSDEAVVGLMARHINQGKPIPTFFYGQDYMGSLDALLVAGGFQLLGESVRTIRAVQLVLYSLSLVTAYALAYTVTQNRRIAGIALLLLSVPTAVGTVYTTISLGGYNELVLLGNVILLLGWQVTIQERRDSWRWALLGLAAGLGWWTNGAIITACLVIGLMGLRCFSLQHLRGYALGAAGFLIGSGPWWIDNLRHDWAALSFLGGGFEAESTNRLISFGESAIGLLGLGFPALYGLRFPWEAEFHITAGIIAGALVYLILVVDGIAGRRSAGLQVTSPPGPLSKRRGGVEQVASRPLFARERGLSGEVNGVIHELPLRARFGKGVSHYAPTENLPKREAIANASRWLWLMFGVFIAVFTLSSFSDATGRYLMPVWVPAAIGVALGLERLRRGGWLISAVAPCVLLIMQGGSVIRAAHTETGLTPQLVERLRTPAQDDDALLAFLNQEGYTRGYASYWTSFRVIFRSHEAVIFDTSLPFRENHTAEGDNRYPPYRAVVAEAERVVWVTQNFPELDEQIAAQLEERDIRYQTKDIGRYRVYYDFSARIAPADLEAFSFPALNR